MTEALFALADSQHLCDLCGSTEVAKVLSIGHRALVECCGCGLVRLDPVTKPEELHAIYENSSYYTTLPPKIPEGIAEQVRQTVLTAFWNYPGRRSSTLTSLLRPFLRPLKYRVMPVPYPNDLPVLDIGCGNGQRLLELEKCGHKQLYGIEPTVSAANQAQHSTRATIYPTTLENAPLQGAYFGLVIMNQVLEHVPSPKTTLLDVRRLLRPDGILYLTVPNFGSLEARIFDEHWAGLRIPEHLHHFTPSPLRKLLESAGFRILTCRTDTVLSITKESVEIWSHARGGTWRQLIAQLPSLPLLPITLLADRCRLGQMLRIVAVSA